MLAKKFVTGDVTCSKSHMNTQAAGGIIMSALVVLVGHQAPWISAVDEECGARGLCDAFPVGDSSSLLGVHRIIFKF